MDEATDGDRAKLAAALVEDKNPIPLILGLIRAELVISAAAIASCRGNLDESGTRKSSTRIKAAFAPALAGEMSVP